MSKNNQAIIIKLRLLGYFNLYSFLDKSNGVI